MHADADKNYSSHEQWGHRPPDIDSWSDKTVVLTLWANTRYQRMTGDTQMDLVSRDLRMAWREISRASTDDDWSRLRRKFEEHGWHGSPISE